ncbi:hypothetical protein [Flavobacterium sp. UBA6135]|uniref:hypothetical protein n=1 Tax=Flavobacterium sp. UBA6135 TaxID=1946553 RepID=UPI0025BB914E|nr:hypothetical protein [Flavobacterium sp. UBA6135]
MKKLFFSLTAIVMFSATSFAKTIEIEPIEKTIENISFSEEFSNLNSEEITICYEVGRTVTEPVPGIQLITVTYRCREFPDSGLGDGTVYINAQ